MGPNLKQYLDKKLWKLENIGGDVFLECNRSQQVYVLLTVHPGMALGK